MKVATAIEMTAAGVVVPDELMHHTVSNAQQAHSAVPLLHPDSTTHRKKT